MDHGNGAIQCRLAVVMFTLLTAAAPWCAQAQKAGKAPPSASEARARAVERCKAERGVDCDTPQGLREWELQERSRAQAVREGSRVRGRAAAPR